MAGPGGTGERCAGRGVPWGFEQRAAREGRWRTGGVWRRHRSCSRLWRSVTAAGRPTVTVEDQAHSRPIRSSVIVSRPVAAPCTGGCVDLLDCGDGRSRHPHVRANSIARWCSRRAENAVGSRTLSHCLRGPYLDGLPARGREGEQPGHRSARAARRSVTRTARPPSMLAVCPQTRCAARRRTPMRRPLHANQRLTTLTGNADGRPVDREHDAVAVLLRQGVDAAARARVVDVLGAVRAS